MCNEKLWDELLPFLSCEFDFVFLDIPLDKNFDEIADHFKALIGSDVINLVGFFLGGYVATYFASKYPKSIAKLFVISNSPSCLPDNELQQRRSILNYVAQYSYSGISRKKAAGLLDPTNQNDKFIDVILEMESELGEDVFISQYKYTSDRIDLASKISTFEFPTYFFVSDDDPLVNTKWLSELINCNSNVEVIYTSGSGHMLPLEKPRELTKSIAKMMHN